MPASLTCGTKRFISHKLLLYPAVLYVSALCTECCLLCSVLCCMRITAGRVVTYSTSCWCSKSSAIPKVSVAHHKFHHHQTRQTSQRDELQGSEEPEAETNVRPHQSLGMNFAAKRLCVGAGLGCLYQRGKYSRSESEGRRSDNASCGEDDPPLHDTPVIGGRKGDSKMQHLTSSP